MKKDNLENIFYKDLLKCLKKIKINKTKNIYVTSDLRQISMIRISKKKKLDLIIRSLKKVLGDGYTIFSPSSSFNIIDTKNTFYLDKTPSYKMGPLAEYIRCLKHSKRSLHPFWSISGIGKNSKVLNNISKHAYAYGSPWSKMLDLNTTQLNLGIKPSRAVTLIHHIETICGVPYRFNKKFECMISKKNKLYKDEFYLSVFFKNQNIKKRIKLNEHFFKKLKKENKILHIKSNFGLDMWSFKMRDFFEIAISYFLNDMYNYLEYKPNLDFQKKL